MRGGLQKRFKTRLGRIRYLAARRQEFGTGLFVRAAIAESVKVLLDAGLTAVSGRYEWLRLREAELTPAELVEWRRVCASLESAAPMASEIREGAAA